MGAKGKRDWDILESILRFTDQGLRAWNPEAGLSSEERLLITWYHAHRLASFLDGIIESHEEVASSFRRVVHPATQEVFVPEWNIRRDVLNPLAIDFSPFLIGGLEYAIGGDAYGFADRVMWSELVSGLVHSVGDTVIPSSSMSYNTSQCTDVLGSFVGGDRGRKLKTLFPDVDVPGLGNAELDELLRTSVARLAAGEDPSFWLLLFATLRNLPASQPILPLMRDLILETDFAHLFAENMETGRIALHVGCSQASHLRDPVVNDHLAHELFRMASLDVSGSAISGSSREGGLYLFEACAMLARAKSTDISEVVEEFVNLSIQLIEKMPDTADAIQVAVLQLYEELPIPLAQKLSRLLVRTRAV